MLVEVDFDETSVNTITDNVFEAIVSSMPRSKTVSLRDYSAIVSAGVEELFGQTPAYLKELEKRQEEYVRWQQKKEANDRHVKKFVEEMLSLQEKNHKEDCMYRVYEQMSIWSMEHKIDCCDDLLDNIDVELFDIHILLSLLMATFPMRQRLNYRRNFFTKVQNHARQRYSEEKMNELFVGLE